MKIIISESVLLNERYINLFNDDDKKQYSKIVWDILEKSYEPIGGFKTAINPEELIQKSYLWKLVRKNNEIVAVKIYRKQFGLKSIAGGTNGTSEGKNALKKMMMQDMKMQNSWGEFSGAPEHILLKYGGAPIPNEEAKIALNKMGKKVLSLDDDGIHYTREIMGKPYKKVMIGWMDKNK
jgi:hypothetical protein